MIGKQKKQLPSLALKTLIFSVLLLAGYYRWWLQPRLELPRALATAEHIVATRQANVLHNRLVLMELLRLGPHSATLDTTYDDLLNRLKATHEEGEKLLAQEISLPSLKSVPTEEILFVTSDLPASLNQLRDQHHTILEGQKELYENLIAFHERVAKLYQYNPVEDLGKLDVTTETEAILNRAQAAREGLGKISKSLPGADLTAAERSRLEHALTNSQGQLTLLIEAAQSGDNTRLETTRSAFISHFSEVKEAVLSIQRSLITSDAAIQNLTQHTNLLLAYNFWLIKINEHQADLGR